MTGSELNTVLLVMAAVVAVPLVLVWLVQRQPKMRLTPEQIAMCNAFGRLNRQIGEDLIPAFAALVEPTRRAAQAFAAVGAAWSRKDEP